MIDRMIERITIRSPVGEDNATDDRDAHGFVDQHGAAMATEAQVWGAVKELSTQEIMRAGGEAGQRMYKVVLHADLASGVTLNERRVLRRDDQGNEELNIVGMRTPEDDSLYTELLCKRAM